ncbi:MAG TPA: tetratricopeptide repeat protein [Candidatus Bipolaricaulota bacterium]|nr:tetratricopeptide repeat protein [Candidatus Bipolaricaulota bacterium]
MKIKEVLLDLFENFTRLFIFLIPFAVLFFLPNHSFVSQSKQFYIIGLALLLLFFWCGWLLLKGKHDFRSDKVIYIAPALLFLATLVSALFSKYRYGSFWGVETWTGSVMTLAAFLIIFFVLINYFRKGQHQKLMLMLSSLAAVAESLLVLSGAGLIKAAWLPVNLLGHNAATGLIAIMSLMVCLGLFADFLKNKKDLCLAMSAAVISLINLIALAMVGGRKDWGILLGAVFVFIAFYSLKKKKLNYKFLVLPALLALISIGGLIFGRLNSVSSFAAEPLPSVKTSFHVAKEAFFSAPLTGIGVNNYSIAYNLFRPDSVNQTAFWNETFYFSATKFSDYLAVGGLVLAMAYLLFIIYFAVKICGRMLRPGQSEYFIGLSAAWLAFAIGGFFYMNDLMVELFGWLVLAGIVISLLDEKTKRNRIRPSRLKMAIWVLAPILMVASVGGLYYSTKRLLSASAYFLAIKNSSNVQMQSFVEKWLTYAVKWDKKNDNYQRQLAMFYVRSLNNLKQYQPKEGKEAEYQAAVEKLIRSANVSALAAVENNPNNFFNHTTLADLFSSLDGWTSNSSQWLISSLDKALRTNSNNVLILNRAADARVRLASDINIAKDNLEKDDENIANLETQAADLLGQAKNECLRAIELKKNYLPTYFTLSMTEFHLGNVESAITLMENVEKQAPSDAGVKYYLGVMYANSNFSEKAVEKIEQAVSLAPTFSDGYFTLAKIYYDQGQIAKAKNNLKKILEYDPGNEAVQSALAQLGGLDEYQPTLPEISDVNIED